MIFYLNELNFNININFYFNYIYLIYDNKIFKLITYYAPYYNYIAIKIK